MCGVSESDADRHHDTESNSNADRDTIGRRDRYSNPDRGDHAIQHPDQHAHGAERYAHHNTDDCSDVNRHRDGNAGRAGNTDGHHNTHTHANGDRLNGYTDGDRHRHADSDTQQHANADSHRDVNAESHP